MYFIGKINKEIYKCISADIQTDDAGFKNSVITFMRIKKKNGRDC